MLDHLDEDGRRNFTPLDLSMAKQRWDLGGFIRDRMVAYGYLKFNKQSFRKDLCSLGLVVRHGYRGKGIGGLFVRKLLEEARKKHIRKIWIHVYSDNFRAVKFWAEQGFQMEGFLKDNENWDGELRSMFQMCMFMCEKPATA